MNLRLCVEEKEGIAEDSHINLHIHERYHCSVVNVSLYLAKTKTQLFKVYFIKQPYHFRTTNPCVQDVFCSRLVSPCYSHKSKRGKNCKRKEVKREK